jgi:hypothetical protein
MLRQLVMRIWNRRDITITSGITNTRTGSSSSVVSGHICVSRA